ncbi:MAG: Mrp/NBP35 family ATP-binding protein [Dehalococcoidia bacterium]|nr:Mrp/NBP35 family ATP-binding protein [Dehalococcoidia bacterium]
MTRQMSPQEQARLEAIKKTWQQKKEIGNKLAKIKNKIGVYSGKGGVGKTTIAVNLAVTLAQQGYTVGLMDTDIDCPNATRVLGITEKPTSFEGMLIPPEKFGVKILSMAFFQENEEEAIIWRGPMIHNAINQFMQTTDWGELDYMIVDLPPGTSDAPLTVMQVLNLDGFVVVTSPQELSKLDAKRSINMIRKLKINVFGIVENFSGGIFGTGAGETLSEEMDLPFIGRIDMRPDYIDLKTPAVVSNPLISAEYESLCSSLNQIVSTISSD